MPLTQYSTWMPDGRTLAVTPTSQGYAYTLDKVAVDRTAAEAAWNAQPEEWQRGRTLDEALRYWRGGTR